MRYSEIHEAANPNPKKFWLVLNISARTEDTASQLHDGDLHGLKGISASREIVGDFLHTSGNACLVMSPEEVLSANDIEMVDYRSPDYLTQHNMRALFRIWDKSYDRQGKRGMMQNLGGAIMRSLNESDRYRHSTLDYHGLASYLGSSFKDYDHTIDTPDQLIDFVFGGIESMARLHYFELKTTRDDIRDAVMAGLLSTGAVFESESEWLVLGNIFHVPVGSPLLILRPETVKLHYAEWLAGNFTPSTDWQFTHHRVVLEQIEKHSLDDRYSIRFIDEMKFAQTISLTQAKRRERKYS